MTEGISTVAVLGAGSMGHGIAEVSAIAGHDVVMRDVEERPVEDGYDRIEWGLGKLAESGMLDEDPDDVLARIDTEVDLETTVADADLVIEVAPERLDLKRDTFADLDEITPEDALLATNTSSLSVTEIAGATGRPERVLGLHFFNPPVKMDLVEVVSGEETSEEAAEAGLPEGTCRRADKIGLDVVHEKLVELHEATGEERFELADYLIELVEAGHTGEAAGRGFYDYSDPPYFYVGHDLDDDGVLTVTLDREERLNAFNDDMFEEVDRLLRSVDVEEVSCVVFEGAGDRAFSAGADVTAFTTSSPTEMMGTDDLFQTVYTFERPTIAKIDGFCLGAGFELALACDVRLATEDARLGTPEIDLGVIPGGGATQRLVRLVGEMRTKELVYRGEQFDGERAEEWGIVNRAVPDDEFDDLVSEYVSDLTSGPPIALKLAKRVIHEGRDASLETGLEYESKAFWLLASTEDMVEGVRAFREDREPEFEGA